MSDRQLIEDLLSALEYHTEQTRPIEFSKVAIEAAREYLHKPAQQEPVVRWVCKGCGHEYMEAPSSCDCMESREYERVEYFTSPPASKPWVGLTEAEIKECFKITPDQFLPWHIYQRIEAKLKEKNT